MSHVDTEKGRVHFITGGHSAGLLGLWGATALLSVWVDVDSHSQFDQRGLDFRCKYSRKIDTIKIKLITWIAQIISDQR